MGGRGEIIKMWLFIRRSVGGHGDAVRCGRQMRSESPSNESKFSLFCASNSGKSQLRMQEITDRRAPPGISTHAANAEDKRERGGRK